MYVEFARSPWLQMVIQSSSVVIHAIRNVYTVMERGSLDVLDSVIA